MLPHNIVSIKNKCNWVGRVATFTTMRGFELHRGDAALIRTYRSKLRVIIADQNGIL